MRSQVSRSATQTVTIHEDVVCLILDEARIRVQVDLSLVLSPGQLTSLVTVFNCGPLRVTGGFCKVRSPNAILEAHSRIDAALSQLAICSALAGAPTALVLDAVGTTSGRRADPPAPGRRPHLEWQGSQLDRAERRRFPRDPGAVLGRRAGTSGTREAKRDRSPCGSGHHGEWKQCATEAVRYQRPLLAGQSRQSHVPRIRRKST